LPPSNPAVWSYSQLFRHVVLFAWSAPGFWDHRNALARTLYRPRHRCGMGDLWSDLLYDAQQEGGQGPVCDEARGGADVISSPEFKARQPPSRVAAVFFERADACILRVCYARSRRGSVEWARVVGW